LITGMIFGEEYNRVKQNSILPVVLLCGCQIWLFV
jgi:hypothetical protein